MLLLSGKYVDDLNRERDSLGRTQSGDSGPDLCVLRGAYLACQVQSRGLWERAVDLPQHPAQLGHHGPKVMQERSDGLLEHPANSLAGNGREGRAVSERESVGRQITPRRPWKNPPTSTTSESSSHLLRMVWINGNTCCSTTTTWETSVK